jgi:polar amino acid transport system substrate-binding protein
MQHHNMSARRRMTAAVFASTVLIGTSLYTVSSMGQGGPDPTSIQIPEAPKDATLAAKIPAAIREKGYLDVVMSPNNPPGHYFDQKTQSMVGLNPDLGKALAEVLGLKFKITGVDFRQVIPGLQAQRYDVAISFMSPTEERKKVLDFFDYLASGVKIGVKTGNPKKVAVDDLSICGHSVAVNSGSAQELRNAPALSQRCVKAGKPEITISSFTDFQTAALAVVSGRADSVMMDGTAIDYMVKMTGELEVGGKIDSKAVSVGVLKDSPMFPLLREAFIVLMKDGIYQKILAKWGLESGAVSDPVINNPDG